MRSRRTTTSAALVALALLLTACGEDVNRAADVRAAIDEARLSSYRFTYTETNPETSFTVKGLVEDDFRYKAQLELEGDDVLDEIAVDDALAVRVHDSSFLKDFVDEEARAGADLSTDLEGIDVLSALATRRWVLDPVGAPAQTSPDRGLAKVGADPVFDAFSVFEYVEQSIRDSGDNVVEYSEEAINPTYRRTEDLFPVPESGSGVTRYDLVRPRMPNIADLTSGTGATMPSTKHFRKMAIYVEDGRLIRVEERVEVVGTGYKRFIGYLRDLLEEIGAPQEVLDGFDDEIPSALPESMPVEEQVEWSTLVLTAFNETLALTGGEPIRVRHMILDLQDFDDPSIDVSLPAGDDVVTGSLAALRSRGRKPAVTAVEEP